MLRDSLFYSAISADELHAVYQAIARKYSGTGHWYTCMNKHPFRAGGYGLPMEQSRSLECGAAVWGTDQNLTEGAQRDLEIERLADYVGGVRL